MTDLGDVAAMSTADHQRAIGAFLMAVLLEKGVLTVKGETFRRMLESVTAYSLEIALDSSTDTVTGMIVRGV